MIYKSIKELKEEYVNRKIDKEQLSELLRLSEDCNNNLNFDESFTIYIYNRIVK